MKEVLGVKLYDLAEVGQLLGVQRSTCYKYIKKGKLKARLIGGAKFVSEENLKEFLRDADN